jgi:hypothetical protein
MKKINITTARRLFDQGNAVITVPCNCSPLSMFAYKLTPELTWAKFDQAISEYAYYNCNAELGRYLHYYAE